MSSLSQYDFIEFIAELAVRTVMEVNEFHRHPQPVERFHPVLPPTEIAGLVHKLARDEDKVFALLSARCQNHLAIETREELQKALDLMDLDALSFFPSLRVAVFLQADVSDEKAAEFVELFEHRASLRAPDDEAFVFGYWKC